MNDSIETKYSHLTPQKDFKGRGQCVTANIRAHLKHLYHGVKFGVTNKHSINVNWVDGPTSEQLKLSLSIFDYSDSDIQSDYHGIKSTDFTNLFGGSQYIFTNRKMSDEYIINVLERNNKNRHSDNAITFEEFNNNDFSNYFNSEDHNNSFSHHFWNDFEETEAAIIGGYLTEGEGKKYINTDNFKEGIIFDALKQGVDTFYLTYYVYYIQPQVLNAEIIEEQKKKIIELTEEYRCKALGIETPSEKSTRLYNEEVIKTNKRINNITPIDINMLDNNIDVNIKMPGCNKNCTIEENNEQIKDSNYVDEFELYKIITLSKNDFDFVSNNLLQSMPNLWGGYPESGSYYNCDEGVHWPVIKVINNETNECFFVDTQGHNYARYVGVES